MILIMLPMLLAVPAMADEDDDVFIDVLDYGYCLETGTNSFQTAAGSVTVSYDLPYRMSTQYVDLLFTHYSAYAITGVDVYHYNGTTRLGSLTVVQVSDSLYRAYGTVSATYTTQLKLKFTSEYTAGNGNLTLYHFLVSPMATSHIPIEGTLLIQNGDNVDTINYRPTDSSNSRMFTWNTNSPIFLTASTSNWLSYDFLEINIELYNVISVSSISAMLDRQPLPVEVSYLDNGSGDYEFTGITVRVDLRAAEKVYEGDYEINPMIYINAVPASGTAYVNVYGMVGYVVVEAPSEDAFWFTKLSGWIGAQTSAIGGFFTSLGDNINTWILDATMGITHAVDSVVAAVDNGTYQIRYQLESILSAINTGVDEIVSAITGGDQADDLRDGADQIGEAGTSLGDDVGSIKDFEDQYFGDLDANMGTIITGGDLSGIVAPLAFVQRYVNLAVAGVPSNYLVIFTLPILLGIFMYIVGHPIKAPRPDTSGDTVTRETFTTTTVLSGHNAGASTTTRTVTTSTEIGRVHNE